MEKKDIDSIILRVLSEQTQPGDKAKVDDWLKESEGNREYFAKLSRYWQYKAHRGHEEKLESTWEKVEAKRGLDKQVVQKGKVRSLKLFNTLKSVAAVVTLLLVAFLVYQYGGFSFEPKKETLAQQPLPELIKKTTEKGRKLTLKLADGTIVKMNSESELITPPIFEEGKREVFLTGEAFFDVAEDKERPFIIHSAGVQTIVHGTSFNVKSYPSDNKVQVALVSGKVELQKAGGGKGLFLAPNQMASFEKGKEIFTTAPIDWDKLAWKDGVLIFRNAAFREVEERLERWYGLPFELQRDIDWGNGFTGEFHNQSLKAVLEGLSFSGQFSFEIRTDKVIIY